MALFKSSRISSFLGKFKTETANTPPKMLKCFKTTKSDLEKSFRSLEHTMLMSEGACMTNSIVVTDKTGSTCLTLWLYEQHKLIVVEDSKKMGH